MNKNVIDISSEKLEKSTEILRALAHPIRLAVVELLSTNKAMSVTEIYTALSIEQAVASHHLRILKDRGVVSLSREGSNSFYSLKNSIFTQILELMYKLTA
ncbi:MAG: metalloregulator ArsR/SmtB family transcription factor [Chitinophagales bacterium]|nr:helix-turn-helix transcriptional regulator [Bacteroidota bacterium]MCB9043624.1 helix-turn-helix transcriptional regulator [Chitinophagales bacterium]